MPCDTVQTSRVNIGKAAQYGASNVMEGLRAMGHNPYMDGNRIHFGVNGEEWIDTKTGEARLSGYTDQVELCKQIGYAVVRSQAKRFGWAGKQDQNGTFVFQKARF